MSVGGASAVGSQTLALVSSCLPFALEFLARHVALGTRLSTRGLSRQEPHAARALPASRWGTGAGTWAQPAGLAGVGALRCPQGVGLPGLVVSLPRPRGQLCFLL